MEVAERALNTCDTRSMSEIREVLERPLVLMALGTIVLLFAISAFAGGGATGILFGLLLSALGGRAVWRGFTKWNAEHS